MDNIRARAPKDDVSQDSRNTARTLRPKGEPLMTLSDVSELLSIPIATLYGWRHRGEGPSGFRVGRYVRYERSTVEEWIQSQVERAIAGSEFVKVIGASGS